MALVLDSGHPINTNQLQCFVFGQGDGSVPVDIDSGGQTLTAHGDLLDVAGFYAGVLATNFDGTGDYVDATANNAVAKVGAAAFSFLVLARPTNANQSASLFSYRNASSNFEQYIFQLGSTNSSLANTASKKLSLTMHNGGSINDANSCSHTTDDDVIDGGWHVYGFIRNGTTDLFYIDGNLVAHTSARDSTGPINPDNTNSNCRQAIGSHWNGLNPFNGDIALIRHWNAELDADDWYALGQDPYLGINGLPSEGTAALTFTASGTLTATAAGLIASTNLSVGASGTLVNAGAGVGATSLALSVSGTLTNLSRPGIDMEVLEWDHPLTTGIHSFATTDYGGGKPKAMLNIMPGHWAPPTPPLGQGGGTTETDTLRLHIGAAIQGAESCVRTFSAFNVGNTIVTRSASASQGVYMYAPVEATLDAFITNGFNLNFSSVYSSYARRVFSVLFGGDDLQVAQGIINLGTGTSPISESIGFQPDLIIFFSNCGDLTTTSFLGLSYGFAARTDLGVDQRCISWAENNGLAVPAPAQVLLTNRCAAQQSNSGTTRDWEVTASNFNASGFDVTPNANCNSDRLHYLALKLGDRQVKVWDFATPTTTGQATDNNPGFRPEFVMAALTQLEAADVSIYNQAEASSFSISAISANNQSAACWREDYSADPTDNSSFYKAAAMLGADNANQETIVADFVEFAQEGVTLDYTAVQGAAKLGIAFAISAQEGATVGNPTAGRRTSIVH